MNIPQWFETLQKKSGMVAVWGAVWLLLNEAFLASVFVGDVFGFFTKLGLLGRATGWVGKKVSQ